MVAHIAFSLLKRRHPWFISWSNNALATASFHSGMVGRFLRSQFRAQHERPGLVTASDHVERPLSLALVDELMARLHGCAWHFASDSLQHIAYASGHKRGEQES